MPTENENKKPRDWKKLQKGGTGPNGRPFCTWCEKEVGPRRRTFCGEACIHEYNIRSNPSYARLQVYLRDKGVCALCGVDTDKIILPDRNSEYWRIKEQYDRSEKEYRDLFSDRTEMTIQKSQILIEKSNNLYKLRLAMNELLLKDSGGIRQALIASGWPPGRVKYGKTLWDMDHTIPVVLGGGGCGLDNLRTLCCICHGKETAMLAKSRKMKRREKAKHGH